MKQVTYLNVWLDHPAFGCGKRDFIAIAGRKWVTLVLVATAEHARVTMAQYREIGGKPLALTPRLARRLRRNAKVFGREASASVREALRLLRQPGAPAPAPRPAPLAARTGTRSRKARTAPEPSMALLL